MLVAKRLAGNKLGENAIAFGTYGKVHGFEDETWLDYSAYTTGSYTCEGHGMYVDRGKGRLRGGRRR